MRTTNRRVYAIGDSVDGPSAENRAASQAHQVLRPILFRRAARGSTAALASLAMTDPGLAAVGLDENAARAAYKDVRVLRLPFTENDLAQAERATTGMIKVIATRGGRILGAAAVGRQAGETIGLWSLAIAGRFNLRTFGSYHPPYPSRAETTRQVAATLDGPGLTPLWQRRIIELLRKLG